MEFETNNTSHLRGNTTNLTDKEEELMLAKGASKTPAITNLDMLAFSNQSESGRSNPNAAYSASTMTSVSRGNSLRPSLLRGGGRQTPKRKVR